MTAIKTVEIIKTAFMNRLKLYRFVFYMLCAMLMTPVSYAQDSLKQNILKQDALKIEPQIDMSLPALVVEPLPPLVTDRQSTQNQPELRPSLLPPSKDPMNVEEVILPQKRVAILKSSSSWDNGYKHLNESFKKLETDSIKAGFTPSGKPISLFKETDDNGFRYEAMLPVSGPDNITTISPDIRIGTNPSGKAWRFVFKGPYEDIDSIYETITAYLDEKGILANDAFLEEYVTAGATESDPGLEINIFVLQK